MSHTHHSHLFSHEWFEVHPQWVRAVKRVGIPLVVGAVLALAAAMTTDQGITFPVQLSEAVHVAEPGTPQGAAVGYFPEQFYAEAMRAVSEELPPQF